MDTITYHVVEYSGKVREGQSSSSKTYKFKMGFLNKLDAEKFEKDQEFNEFLVNIIGNDVFKSMGMYDVAKLIVKSHKDVHAKYMDVYGKAGRTWDLSPQGDLLAKNEVI